MARFEPSTPALERQNTLLERQNAMLEQRNAALEQQLRSARAALGGARHVLELLTNPHLAAPGAGDEGAYFQSVASAVVSSLADGCTIDVVDGTGVLRLAAAHADVERESELRRAARREDGDDAAMQGAVLRMPLYVHGSQLGTLTIWSEAGRALLPAELTVAHWLGHQVALVLENQRLERVVVETREASDSLLSMVSHEIRTPLSTISMGVESSMLRIEASADELPKNWLLERLQKIKRAVRRSDRLIHTLLGMSQVQMGRLLPDARSTDVATIAEDVIEALREELSWAGCDCTLHCSEPQRGYWDPIQLEIALNNLVTNAIKYAPHQPLEVTVVGDAQYVDVSVRDHGPGIPAEHRDRLFQRFSRLPSATRAPGFGLGLWIVKHFVEANGGSVSCDSDVGHGTTFSFRLPRAGSLAAAAASPSS